MGGSCVVHNCVIIAGVSVLLILLFSLKYPYVYVYYLCAGYVFIYKYYEYVCVHIHVIKIILKSAKDIIGLTVEKELYLLILIRCTISCTIPHHTRIKEM